MKTIYAVGVYNGVSRREDPEWMKSGHNRLVAFIYDNQEMFNIRYITEETNREMAWIILDTKELLKAKECFSHEETTNVNDFIDICQEHDKWQTKCECCDSITLNTIPYTYRGYECVGREYNCPICASFKDRIAYYIRRENENHGIEKAIDLIKDLCEGTFEDKLGKYYCPNCDMDLRITGIVHQDTVYRGEIMVENGRAVFDEEGNVKYIAMFNMPLDKHNELELKNAEECGSYPALFDYQPEDSKNDCYCVGCREELSIEDAKKVFNIKGE